MSDKTAIIDYAGNTARLSCLGCAQENGEMERLGTVLTTDHFDAHQDFEIPISSFMSIAVTTERPTCLQSRSCIVSKKKRRGLAT